MPDVYYEDDFVQLYHGDCREILPTLGPVDLVLTDPPYGIGSGADVQRHTFAPEEWDAAPVEHDLLQMCIAKAPLAIVWGGNYFDLPPHQQFFVWDKVQPEEFTSAMVEQAWTNSKGPAKLFRRRVVGYKKLHPTQKPIELMLWCLDRFPDATTILDPFMGSGTTLVAAKDLQRQAIGIEREEKYCEVAANRLASFEPLPLPPAAPAADPPPELFPDA